MTGSDTMTATGGLEALLPSLIKLSRECGADPELVLGGGGNTSVKADGRMLVKASGAELARIDADGFVAVDQSRLLALLEDEAAADDPAALTAGIAAARLDPAHAQRPSVECILHALLPQTFIVHTHPTPANILGCCTQAHELAAEWFGDELLVTDYVDFGLSLARTLRQRIEQYRKQHGHAPGLILVRNHGLFAAADSADAVRHLMQRVVDTIRRKLGPPPAEPFGPITRADDDRRRQLLLTIAPAMRGLLAETHGQLAGACFDDGDAAMQLAGGAEGRAVTEAGPITPDQVAYAGSFPLWFDPPAGQGNERALIEALRRAIDGHTSAHAAPPRIVLVPGVGLFATGRSPRSAQTAAAVYRQTIAILAGARQLGGVNVLTGPQRRFVERASGRGYGEPAAGGPEGRVGGKVALVTGAAQGFGLEIARNLAAEGAYVVLADINQQGAAEQAAAIVAEHGPHRAIGLAVNVTGEESVAACIEQAVRACGGLDVLVANAGVLRAESVKTQALSDFEFVTAVNYTGYFACVKHAAPVMATQHAACPDYRGDIIQINSKSGLTGSNRNAAYAGSKFGGVGLTQSFALELIEDGIKVNSICPGNFFDGPLWSDPENGLFVQYLRTGKVPGAETIEDVKRAYEEKVPMKRGCTAADVMRAIYYLIEQQYETGQALPVTGGQVMLR